MLCVNGMIRKHIAAQIMPAIAKYERAIRKLPVFYVASQTFDHQNIKQAPIKESSPNTKVNGFQNDIHPASISVSMLI